MEGTSKDSNLPRISIITPCRNGERYIVDAIESLLRQNYSNFEHIIVDGGSTDRTHNVIAAYAHLTVIFERDEGSHDAMNKGIRRATGDVIGFLNVDDVYAEGALCAIGAAFAANPSADIVVGDSVVFEDTERGNRAIRFRYTHPKGVWLAECLFGNPGINGCFFRRSVFDNVGLFSTRYGLAADREFLMRTALAHLRLAIVNKPTIWYRAHVHSRNFNRQRSNMLLSAGELFGMASVFLELSKREHRHKNIALAWHAFEGARLLYLRLRHGQYSQALQLWFQYILRNPLWPFHLMHALVLRRTVRRNYRGRWNADLSANTA